MTNAFILCDLVWKVQKRDAAKRESSFKSQQSEDTSEMRELKHVSYKCKTLNIITQ